ncbi:Diaminopimelate decarboxylase [Streptomyces glaucescens]
MDVASLGELQHALGAGFTPDRITATGPKNPEFLWLAARTSVTVSVDSREELDQLAALVRAFTLPRVPRAAAPVRLRGGGRTGAEPPQPVRYARCGPPTRCWRRSNGTGTRSSWPGWPSPGNTISFDEKATALEGCLRALEEARKRGLRPRAVDVGGGFGLGYLADGEQWERSHRARSPTPCWAIGHR